MAPARDIGFVRIRNTQAQTVQLHLSCLGQMEDELVAIIGETLATERFEMPGTDKVAFFGLNGNGLDPVKRVLEHKQLAQLDDQFVREERVGWASAKVQ